MTDIFITRKGLAGRITLNRPTALNAMTHAMCSAIAATLDAWADDPDIALVIFDALGDKAFCAGGDIAKLYATGINGDFAYGQTFWRDEYRLNAKLHSYSKPVVSMMQGFTMGGGVGLGCHGSHRIVGQSSQIAMPECGIGLIPDVGGSLILARAPGHLGEYLGTTATRMNASDAIMVGFADYFIPETDWPALIATLEQTGDCRCIQDAVWPTHTGPVGADREQIDRLFSGATLRDIIASLRQEDSAFSQRSLKAMGRNSPLSMACAIACTQLLRGAVADLHSALALEYRFTYRAMEHGDFLEGIRAAIIDKDRKPNWQHPLDAVPVEAVAQMLAPLANAEITF